ncbi:MAG TPA: SDR family oxidoreductase [Steroidobacteraceae bacterium]|nr:SDR family oxidoreductase [Steroidobacteraceae bacterium]
MRSLEGKIALVTGGSRGIGAGIVRRLTTEGAQVVFTYPSVSDGPDAVLRSIADAGGKAWAFEADSSDPQAVEAAVDRTAEKASRLDILVNNAGIITIARLGEFSLQDFDRMVAINIRGVFVASKAASRHMSSGGRIINIGSCNADRMPFEGGSIYAMTKAAVAGLTRGMARDLGPRGITVNTVQPGPTNTDLNPVDGPYAPTFLPMLAVQRFAHVDEIAGMVAYLASPEAAFVTGAMLTIDGGFNA